MELILKEEYANLSITMPVSSQVLSLRDIEPSDYELLANNGYEFLFENATTPEPSVKFDKVKKYINEEGV